MTSSTNATDTVTLQPIEYGSTLLVADFLARLSPESRRLRFFTPMPRISSRLVEQMCNVDHRNTVAWMAVAGGEMVAEARFGRWKKAPERADVGLAVRDDWQSHGLGRRMLEVLGLIAAQEGICAFTCDVLPDNRPSLGLLRAKGFDFRFEGGVLEGYAALLPGWTGSKAEAEEIIATHQSIDTHLAGEHAA